MPGETIFQLHNTTLCKITKAKPHDSWLYLEETLGSFHCPAKSSSDTSGLSIWETSPIRMKTCCQTGKRDSGGMLEKGSVPNIQGGWNTRKGMWCKPCVCLIVPEPAILSAVVPGSTAFHSPANGRKSPGTDHAINTKCVSVVTTRARKGSSMFANKCTSIFFKKLEKCAHSLKYLVFFKLENHHCRISHWLTCVLSQRYHISR